MVLTGDINIHVDSPNCVNAVNFLESIDGFNFTQHVNFPTHGSGHTLDLVCSAGDAIQSLDSTEMSISDHKLITFELNTSTSKSLIEGVITFRNIKHLNYDLFSNSVSVLPIFNSVEDYNSVLSTMLEEFEPLRERVVTFRKPCPWYTTELRLLKARGRQLERQYKKSSLTVHRHMFVQHQTDYHNSLNAASKDYYSKIISDGADNPNVLFKILSKISTCSSVDQCNMFLNYFIGKIENINNSIASVPLSELPQILPTNPVTHAFSSFAMVDIDFTVRTIMSMNSTNCILDTLPSSVLRGCLLSISPHITSIVNSSLNSGSVPPTLKIAAITPVPKKPLWDSAGLVQIALSLSSWVIISLRLYQCIRVFHRCQCWAPPYSAFICFPSSSLLGSMALVITAMLMIHKSTSALALILIAL
ncbi:uncharacterized protein LOC127415287 isoform X1 [Myxocyprinus asiaticus]|uniref:uncharacterized protein LOC127415287 isoform X1 n=1 Tax=Myxocyprinus asiaticus TaxID=70543 RepID=UPI00222164BE|nr:uncharacterized protein LOC127415287 isoform X1 [Myxocyprinus asiaticus]